MNEEEAVTQKSRSSEWPQTYVTHSLGSGVMSQYSPGRGVLNDKPPPTQAQLELNANDYYGTVDANRVKIPILFQPTEASSPFTSPELATTPDPHGQVGTSATIESINSAEDVQVPEVRGTETAMPAQDRLGSRVAKEVNDVPVDVDREHMSLNRDVATSLSPSPQEQLQYTRRQLSDTSDELKKEKERSESARLEIVALKTSHETVLKRESTLTMKKDETHRTETDVLKKAHDIAITQAQQENLQAEQESAALLAQVRMLEMQLKKAKRDDNEGTSDIAEAIATSTPPASVATDIQDTSSDTSTLIHWEVALNGTAQPTTVKARATSTNSTEQTDHATSTTRFEILMKKKAPQKSLKAQLATMEGQYHHEKKRADKAESDNAALNVKITALKASIETSEQNHRAELFSIQTQHEDAEDASRLKLERAEENARDVANELSATKHKLVETQKEVERLNEELDMLDEDDSGDEDVGCGTRKRKADSNGEGVECKRPRV